MALRGDELVEQSLGDSDGAEDVDVEHPLPVFEVGLCHRVQSAGTASIVDQKIDPIDLGCEIGDGFVELTSSSTAVPPMSAATFSILSLRRAATMTCQPSCASAAAVAAPIPEEAPVTIATFCALSCV